MRKLWTTIALLVVLALLLSGCAQPTPVPTARPEPTEAQAQPTAVPEPTDAPEPTEVAEPTEAPQAASALVVTLKEGLKWSDGTDFTSKDVVGTYDIFWMQSASTWNYLTDVVAKDDQTIEFQLKTASPVIMRLVLRSNLIRPYSQYAEFMDQAAELREKNADREGDEVQKAVEELNAFRPDEAVALGPFVLDPKSITEAQLTLVKNPTGYNADKIDFDKLTLFYGETNVTVPLVLAGDIDYSSHGFTPANVKAFEALPEIQILRGPTATGPGLYFNNDVYPLDKKEVRQAFAYIIDREENATVAMGESGKAIKYMAGCPDGMAEAWLPKEVLDQLNPYEKDWAKAEELLTSIGFTKGSDGIWVDDKGQPLAFELSVPSDFADWFGATENAAQQLNKFGIKATVRGYQSSERGTVQTEGKYQILVDLTIYGNPPHPRTAYWYPLTAPRNDPEATDPPRGMNWPYMQKGPDGKEYNVKELIDKAVEGMDPEAQKPYLILLAQIYNEELPTVPLFERYTNDPINTQARVTGWLPLEDKIYRNSQADSYAAIQLLSGGLKPIGAVKEFKSAWPYSQPPNGHLNLFATNGIPTNVGLFTEMQYPPLFWYMWADGKYEPVLAEKCEIK